jgi:hypothetical protein
VVTVVMLVLWGLLCKMHKRAQAPPRGLPRVRGPSRVGRVCVRKWVEVGGRACVVVGHAEEIGFLFSNELSNGFII